MKDTNSIKLTKEQTDSLKLKVQYRSLQIVFWLQVAILFAWVNYDWFTGNFFGINFWLLIGEIVVWFVAQYVFRRVIEKKYKEQAIVAAETKHKLREAEINYKKEEQMKEKEKLDRINNVK